LWPFCGTGTPQRRENKKKPKYKKIWLMSSILLAVGVVRKIFEPNAKKCCNESPKGARNGDKK